jgi:Leucine-rich repeat (LRR) protein
MKLKKTVVWLWCAVLCVLLAACGQTGEPGELTPTAGGNCAPEQVVNIYNSSLRKAVVEQLNQDPSLPICQEDMLQITYIRFGGPIEKLVGAQSLEGLQYATNLKTLIYHIRDYGIPEIISTDISPLANLHKLENLTLVGNSLRDISLLSGLINLKRLDLSLNLIRDASPLSGLVNLEYLDVGFNKISDISWATDLTNLKFLDLGLNQLEPIQGESNLNPLMDMTKLEYLSLAFTTWVEDITPLANLSQLKKLHLEANQISDISPLTNLTQLTEVYLGGNNIHDLTPLANLSQLNTLSLHDNHISNLEPLAYLANVKTLDLANNRVSNIDVLASACLVSFDPYYDGPPLIDLRIVNLTNNPLDLNNYWTYEHVRGMQYCGMETVGVPYLGPIEPNPYSE